ncbi:MAG: NAD(P)/FAD-dependent oxidoreductase [Acidobacteriota bacterium]
MERIVIVGGGFAGATCAQELERLVPASAVEIVLINHFNYFVFTPLLVEAGTGSLEPRHAVVPLRDFVKTATFRTAEVLGADLEKKSLRFRVVGKAEAEFISWDHLVVALGSVTRMPPIPGLDQYAFEMKSLTDAVALRDRAIQLLEQADATDDPEERRGLLHFVVVGANFSGVEVAGEFFVFLREAARYYRNVKRSECAVSVVEIAPRILTTIDEDLAEYALKELTRRGTHVILNAGVSEVGPDHVVLSTGERLRTSTLIWCAGVAPNPLAAQLGLPVSERGAIVCVPDLRVSGFQHVWAIGDCASIPDPRGGWYPPTAQHAVRQGKHLARNLLRVLQGVEPQPCRITSQGSLAALGCRTAVAKVFGLKLAGFPAWFLWRTVYLFKMPGWARRIRVALDWTTSLLFPRPIVQLGVHRTPDRGGP